MRQRSTAPMEYLAIRTGDPGKPRSPVRIRYFVDGTGAAEFSRISMRLGGTLHQLFQHAGRFGSVRRDRIHQRWR